MFANLELRRFLKPLWAVLTHVVIILLCCQCDKASLSGSLKINYIGTGNFEIYKIANEQPLQFVSETQSPFNQRIKLTPGSYMILTDCSSEIVNIYPGSEITLVAHQVNFIPLQPPSEGDKFSIQCLRSERTRSRQNLMNQYSLSILSGTRDLLVGMIPLRLDLNSKDNEVSRVVSHVLSYISVAGTGKGFVDDFFVSPVAGVTPYTENQKPGSKLFVLKGKYDIQLNGTETTVDLTEGESRTIIPGTLSIVTSTNADLDRAEKVRGAPLFAEINGEHYMNINAVYPVLPGQVEVRLATSLRSKQFQIAEGENLRIHARNVVVELGCDENDWACLGSKKIRLFEKDKNFHFAESQTDVPILFFEQDVALGIEGSRNIKLKLNQSDDQRVKVGFLEVNPTPIHKPGVLTDLMRVEPSGSSMIGTSLDMVLDKQTVMPLFVGNYHLSQFTFVTSDGSRHKSGQGFYIAPGQRVKLDVQTYLSEKRMSAMSGTNEESRQ